MLACLPCVTPAADRAEFVPEDAVAEPMLSASKLIAGQFV
jgi:hypothetical protein